jgi:flagellar export protein FliJ
LSWAQSLIRISTYEVETLQKRLAEVSDRLAAARTIIAQLDVEAELESAAANDAGDIYAMLAHASYAKAWKARREQAMTSMALIERELEGARDALTAAFEEQKKYEHVAEMARVAAVKEAGRRESAALDELGLRRAAAR